ncbi:replication/maintenance protein RepL, partial [Pseudomonas poae]|uniref:replication/maintenance protein RepL n=1 Tax=Pseudomonas poae TaxID=200451 RepID=UPI0034D3A614
MSRTNTKSKILTESTTTFVDADGNVIEQTNIKEMSVPREPNFVKLYIDGLSRIFDLSGGENKFLVELLKYVTYENEITLNSGVKKRISERTGYKPQTIDNYISTLK